ncbi:MAG: TrkA family potassium uptake protein [Thermomicrobiales bacterium]|nr:TrkA family potassium uptake protein [Thermomicrobiales bacterium]
MRVVIVGCGRLGARIASKLDSASHEVVIIDTNPRAFRRLAPGYRGDTIIGTGIDEDVLRQAGIERADAFIAVTEGDNRNIFAAQVARVTFAVPRVSARIYDPVRADTYRNLGLEVICPTVAIADDVLASFETEA